MKVHVEIDCTPEEARSFMGLPDVQKANDVYMDTVTSAMKGVSNPDQLQEYAKNLAPMGQMGLKLFQNFVENGLNAAGGGASKSGGKSNRQVGRRAGLRERLIF